MAVGISSRRVYKNWLTDEDFADRAALVFEEVTDKLEQEAIDRAMVGSDNLLITLLKARKAEFNQKVEISGPGGTPLELASARDKLAQMLLTQDD